MLHRILVPVDGSPLAERAVPTAARLAGAAGGEVILAQVHRMPAITAEAALPATLAEPAVLGRESRYVEELAERVRSRFDVVTRTRLMHGDVADALHVAALESAAHLIVMETHDRGALGRLFVGSVADRVAREPGVPVLVLKPEPAPGAEGARAADPLDAAAAPLRHLLVALDGSLRAERILEPATDIARATDATLTLLGVRDPMLAIAAIADADAAGEDYLAGCARRLADAGLTVAARVVTDRSAAHAIARAVEDVGADLVALTTHGRGTIARLLQGSVADRVLHGVHVPVLLLNPGVDDDALARDRA